jgi:hypothetical protein
LQVALPRHCIGHCPPLQLEAQVPWLMQIPHRPGEQAARQVVPAAQVEAQTFDTPPPPQVWVAEQEPQSSEPPQPSETVPQFFPCAAHVVGVQLVHTLATQLSLPEQLPQLREPPQPSERAPQFFPCAAHVVGVQTLVQRLDTQDWPVPQEPQFSVPPHPSEMLPQFFPSAAQVVGVQPDNPVQFPPLQVAVMVALGSLLNEQFPPLQVNVQFELCRHWKRQLPPGQS